MSELHKYSQRCDADYDCYLVPDESGDVYMAAEVDARLALMQKRIDDAESANMILRGSHDRLLQVIAQHVGDKVTMQQAIDWCMENAPYLTLDGRLESSEVPAELAPFIKGRQS